MFISVEGIEGSGKGTVIQKIEKWLHSNGSYFVSTREPGGSRIGKQIRSILLNTNSKMSSRAEMFLYLADRAEHVETVVKEALDQGLIVLCDRYADTNIVYQGYARGLDVDEIFQLNNIATGGLWPDLTILLDAPPTVGLKRAIKRNEELGMMEKEGRFEAESLSFHTKARDGYLHWAKVNPQRFVIVNADQSPENVWSDVKSILEEKLFQEQKKRPLC